ncbi:hypothetical protein PFISCL1PPCAC_14928, partial [Pristionchus fissidentatus]
PLVTIMTTMFNTTLFTYFNQYPIIPITIISFNIFSFIPLLSLLFICQIAPLHSNCRYILCMWALGYSLMYFLNFSIAILDLKNESGFMPLSMNEPAIRLKIYELHIMSTEFSACFEIVLSTERIIAIIRPRRYHFSGFAFKSLFALTIFLVRYHYFFSF